MRHTNAHDSCMNADSGTLGCQELPRRHEWRRRKAPRVGLLPSSRARLAPALLLALAVGLAREAQAQSNQDYTWAGGADAWAYARTSAAKIVGALFAIEVLVWVLVYGWRHARDQYHKPMVELRATARLKRHFDTEAALRDRHAKLKAAGNTHDVYLRLRRAAEADLNSLSPRHGGGNAKRAAPYNPHKQFKRDARSGNVSAFTAWQQEEEEHQHHELILDGRRAALV